VSISTAIKPNRLTASKGWWFGLAGLTAWSLFNYLWELANGQRSEYYAAIALSMSKSWSNFFFGAMDPSGSVTLDKVPGSYWVPAAFVKVFGFSTWSVNAPNALATVGAVVLMAFAGKQLLNAKAGILAGAIVATTPVLAAVARSNQPESFFLLAMAMVGFFGVRAFKLNSTKNLYFAALSVGLAFHFYMLEAWASIPALALAFLFTDGGRARKWLHATLASFVAITSSLTWTAIVSLFPTNARPYIGGTNHNSVWEMVFGYNGLGRFSSTASSDTDAYRSFTPPFGGSASIVRFFNAQLAGQIGWLIPTAMVALAVLWILKANRAVAVFLTSWFAVMYLMFAEVSGMHQFYTAVMAMPVSLIVALAYFAATDAKALWAQIAIIASSVFAALGITIYYLDYVWWTPLVGLLIAFGAVALLFVENKWAGRLAAVLAGAALVFTPAVWAMDTINHPSSINPAAGDGSMSMGGGFGGGSGGFRGGTAGGAGGFAKGNGGFTPSGGGNPAVDVNSGNVSVLKYVQQHQGSAHYLMAVTGGMQAAPYITASNGEQIIAIGGFNGADKNMPLVKLQQVLKSGQLKFVLLSGSAGGPGGNDGSQATSNQLQSWVEANLKPVTLNGSASGLYEYVK
jgi:4-amino-4-deoxy-L-arabinose transferase-like glycosyltransferase